MNCQRCDDCAYENGRCHCGCGEQTHPLSTSTLYIRHLPEGTCTKFVIGHQNKLRSNVTDERIQHIQELARLFIEEGLCPWCEDECDVGPGLCHCGCGEHASLSNMNRWVNGIAKGAPYRTLRGHHARQLSDQDVRDIRHLYATTEITQDELAEMFGVSQVTICRVMLYDSHKTAGIKHT